MTTRPRTLYEKIWDAHVVAKRDDGTCVLYVDRHLVHEVTSPQAFEGLRRAGRDVRRPHLTLAMPDHNVPTTARVDSHDRRVAVLDGAAALQLATLQSNVAEFQIEYIDDLSPEQGIVHVVGPEQGFTLPGSTVVCGDSHTSSHGALGALGLGIGTSEIEHVLATQTLLLRPSNAMEIRVEGPLSEGVSPKDVALAICATVGAGGASGFVIEYTGSTIRSLSVEGRLTVCNMAVEIGARSGLVAPDEKVFAYLRGRPRSPTGEEWEAAVERWRHLRTDEGAAYGRVVEIDAQRIAPFVTWGTSPEDVVPIDGVVPDPAECGDAGRRLAMEKSLDYMGLAAGTPLTSIAVDRVFIGSCTNSRIEDLRAAAEVVRGRHVAMTLKQALIVPGSGLVKRQAEAEGLDRVFLEAGFEWREPGCSMCLGMNPDQVPSGERCASTSNRNFVGRQGPGARTHLVSPAMAAVAAIAGRLADVREFIA